MKLIKRLIKLIISLLFLPLLSMYFIVTGKKSCVAVTYHSIKDICTESFKRQIDIISKIMQPVSIEDLHNGLPSKRCCLVTFDDGFIDFFTNALPILSEYSVPAVMFVTTGSIGVKPKWLKDTDDPDKDVSLMGHSELRSCFENRLVSIGSHTRNHIRLTQLPFEEAKQEIEGARCDLTEILGTQSRYFSFPHGGYNNDLLRYLKEEGYRYIFTIEPVIYTEGDDTGIIGRVGISPCDWFPEFLLKIYGAYSWLVLCKRFFGIGA